MNKEAMKIFDSLREELDRNQKEALSLMPDELKDKVGSDINASMFYLLLTKIVSLEEDIIELNVLLKREIDEEDNIQIDDDFPF